MRENQLRFVNSHEFELFFARYLAKIFDDRVFINREDIVYAEQMEELCHTSASWRLPNKYCDQILSDICLNHQVLEKIKNASSSLTVLCSGNLNNSRFAKEFEICHCSNDGTSEIFEPSLKRCLNLFLCILSCAIDSRDAWSVTQFFDQLCPHVLPCLRRKAQKTSSQLNIMSVLISYSNSEMIENDSEMNPTLLSYSSIIKKFLDVISSIADKLHDDKPPKKIISSIIKEAINFLKVVKFKSEISSPDAIIPFIERYLIDIEQNFIVLRKIIDNYEQEKSFAITEAYIFALALRDRLSCLCLSDNTIVISELFETPKSTKKLTTKKSLKTKQKCENITSTMPEKALSSFINFGTPERKKFTTSRSANTTADSGIVGDYSDFFDENKENLDPDSAIVIDFDDKKDTKQEQCSSSSSICRFNTVNDGFKSSNIHETIATVESKMINKNHSKQGSSRSSQVTKSKSKRNELKHFNKRVDQAKITQFFSYR